MTPRLSTVDNVDFARWQSAVREIAKEITGDGARMHSLNGRGGAMLDGASDHVRRDHRGEAIPEVPEPNGRPLEHADQRYLSKLHYDIARAKLAGDEERVAELEEETRKYSTADIAGWASCVTTYLKYYDGGVKDPIYNDWKKAGKGDINYGVVQWQVPNDAKIAVIGDFGTGLSDAKSLITQIVTQLKPDAFLHLGDVYYSGTPDECTEHVLELFADVFRETGTKRVPVFLVPGNHEYYARGEGFYPMLKAMNSGLAGCEQKASYFCLRTADGRWQFLGMDTGVRDNNPITPFSPTYVEKGLKSSELEWQIDKLKNFGGNSILLSHHQLFSANNDINGSLTGKPAYLNVNLLSNFKAWFKKVSAWLWGHEHNYVLFANGQFGLNMGRCIGHSGYEESQGETPYKQVHKEVSYLPGMVELDVIDGFYNHGCALIDLKRANPSDPLKISYYQFPSWSQNTPPPNPLPPLRLQNEEQIGDPINTPTWTGNQKISSISNIDPDSNYGPSLCWYGDKLYMIYKGATSNDLYQSVFDGSKWSGNTKISKLPGGISPESNYTPSLTVFNGKLWMIYKGAHSNTLYAAWFDGSKWSGNKKIKDMGGSISPESNYTPGAAVLRGQLYIVYKGAHSNTLYLAWYDGSKWHGNKKIKDMPGGISPESNYCPAAIDYDKQLYIVYKGAHSNTLYAAWYDGSKWFGNVKISDISPIDPESNYTPALASYGGAVQMLYKGAHSNDLYQATLDQGGWSGNVRIEDMSKIDPQSNQEPGASPFNDALFMVYKGKSSNNIYQSVLKPV